MQLREAIASPRTLIISFNFSIARVVKHTLDDFSNILLQRYESALQFYRDIGDRLGEANVLQEFGKLQENPTTALDYLQQAQNLYIQIGDIYSQSRNLLFIADVQLKMGDSNAAVNSLNDAAELATIINYAPFQEYAQTRIAEINSSPAPTNGI